MKFTKEKLKEIIKEEFEKIEQTNQDLSEAEDVDLASLEPAVDSMVGEIEKAAEAASEGQESLKNLLMQSLIAKLQGMID